MFWLNGIKMLCYGEIASERLQNPIASLKADGTIYKPRGSRVSLTNHCQP